jgi:hypothetical protein
MPVSTAPAEPTAPAVRDSFLLPRLLLGPALCLALGSGRARPQTGAARSDDRLPPPATAAVDFKRDVEPILSRNCHRCHGVKLAVNGLRLDDRKAALAGGHSGPVIRPGSSRESKLIQMVAGLDGNRLMPFEGTRLTDGEIGLLRAWIDQGAAWPEDSAAPAAAAPAKPRHWALVPPVHPAVPAVRDRAWVRNPIDAFVLARLEREGIAPSPEADRVTLIRRLSFDLFGLPPTPAEVAEFLADTRPDAYERLVERLLASPHYGEKWAHHWLDLARYADSDGYNDAVRPNAWRYRDWVIDALNANVPFDRFTVEQMAGDLLPDATLDQRIATGFNRNTMTRKEGGTDREEDRTEQVVDRAATVGAVWLGLTVGCARCHDHKYDPITQKEFYQLYAFFNTEVEVDIEAPLPGEIGAYLRGAPEYRKQRGELMALYNAVELQREWEKKLLDAADNRSPELPPLVAWRSLGFTLGGQESLRKPPDRRTLRQEDRVTQHFLSTYQNVFAPERAKGLKLDELKKKLSELAARYPPLSEAQTIAHNPAPPTTHILVRGDYRRPGIEVRPGTPAALHPLPADPRPSRLALARWLVSRDNPLTARVAVNRMWQELFGRGLVATSEDFGTRGEAPTHPELLDWLATEFMDGGWNVKRLHTLIVTSAAYRQSSAARKDLEATDPYNRLLARQARLRLPTELVRDATLAASGLLNTAVGGKSVLPPLPSGMAELGHYITSWKESSGRDRYRRGLYTLRKRVAQYPQFMAFDAPGALQTCSRRERSITPLQALNLLNDPVFFEAAQGLAARVLREKPGTVADRIRYAFRLCLARDARPSEVDRLARYYREELAGLERDPRSVATLFPAGLDGIEPREAAAWAGLGSILLNLDEFITRE